MQFDVIVQVILVLLTWMLGFFTANYISKRDLRQKKDAIIKSLESEISFILKTEKLMVDITADNARLYNFFRDDYINVVLQSGVLNLKKEATLIDDLVKLRGIMKNHNNFVNLFNLYTILNVSLNGNPELEGEIIKFRQLIQKKSEELKEKLNNYK